MFKNRVTLNRLGLFGGALFTDIRPRSGRQLFLVELTRLV